MKPGPVHERCTLLQTDAHGRRGRQRRERDAEHGERASRYRGASSGPPAIASCVARAPKISTGSDSGSISSDSSAPLRSMSQRQRRRQSSRSGSARRSPAPPRAMIRRQSADRCARGRARRAAPCSASGNPVSSQCATVLANSSAVSDWPESAYCSSVPSCASSRNRNSSASSEASSAADPDRTGSDLAQLRQLRRDGEREQHRHHGEERQRLQQLRGLAKREREIALQGQPRRGPGADGGHG